MKGILAFFLAAALMSACAQAEQLRVEFFDVGKADAMLITTPEGTRILIDAATNKEGKKLAERLEREGIDAIDVMIITHYDKDHVGGADQILEELQVGTVYMPVYDKESKQLTQFMEALSSHPPRRVERMEIGSQTEAELPGSVKMSISAAHREDYGEDEENDFSLAVRLGYGETKFFFPGDAEHARQMELLAEGDIACDVLKVPHHGKYEKSSPAFLAACAPEIAFIPDDEEEPADERVLSILKEIGAQVFCAKDGDLTVYSDGKNVWTEK